MRDLNAARSALKERLSALSFLIGHSLDGAAAIAAAGEMASVIAIATIGAPFDAEHVTHLLGDGLQTLERQGHAEVDIGGKRFMLRRTFVEDLRRQTSVCAFAR